MTPRVYPFIDIAVLDAVRGHFLAGDAIAILSTDLETVIWANGPGAALFGHGDIGSVRGAPANLGFPARRQIAGTPGFPAIGQNRALLVRVAQGMTSRAIGFLASAIALPDGVRAIMLVAPDVDAGKRSAAEIAARVIHGIAEAEHHAALIDGVGTVIAASDAFGATGIDAQALAGLAADVMQEQDRLAKRLVPTGDVAYPVGIARLGEEPARHLVIVVDDPQPLHSEGTEDKAPIEDAGAEPTSLDAEIAPPPVAQAKAPPAADESDSWYFDDVAPARPLAQVLPPEPMDGEAGGDAEPPLVEDTIDTVMAELAAEGDAEAEPDGTEFQSVDEAPIAEMPEAKDEAAEGQDGAPEIAAEGAVEQDLSPPAPEPFPGSDTPAYASLTPANDAGTAKNAAGHGLATASDEGSATGEAFAEEQAAAGIAGTESGAPVFKPDLKSGPVRFVWRTDAEGRFSAMSDEFASAVGKAAADIVGRPFRDVALTFGLDPDGEIASLLERRDTWSGRSVMWPIEGTDLKVPVDLAALPVYARDRSFEGFRGFGVVRVGDAVVDDEAIGLSLARGPAPVPAVNDPVQQAPGNDPFAGELPAIAVDTTPERRQTDKVIRLAEHRPAAGERTLSPVEKNAFREIGDRLKEAGAAPSASAEEDGADDPEPEPAGPTQASDEADPFEAVSGPSGADADDSDEVPFVQPDMLDARPATDEPEKEAPTGADDDLAQAVAIDDEAGLDQPDERTEEPPADVEATWPAYDPGEVEGVSSDEPHRFDGDEPYADQVEGNAFPDSGDVEAFEADADADVSSGAEPTSDAAEAIVTAGDGPGDGEDVPLSVHDEESVDGEFDETDQLDRIDPPESGQGDTLTFDGEIEPEPEDAEDDAAPPRGVDTSILERLPVPVLIHSGDHLYYANEDFLELTGYVSVHELQQAGGLDALFVEDRETEDRNPDDHRRTLRSRNGEEFRVDALLQSVPWNGGKALLLALKPASLTPMASASEEELAELESRVSEMSTILDTATDGIVIIANDGTIRSISRPAEALFGFDNKTVAGKPFVSLFAVESQRAARDYLNGLSDNGVASVLNDGREVIGREAQGRFIPLFMTIGKLPGAKGYCAVLRDITQWKRAEEELTQARAEAERASSQKTEFLARISHEIRTPLNAIIGFSELMIDEKFGPIVNDRYRDYLRDINRSGNHVLDLVNDLLDISKIEAGEQEMAYEAVSLNETLAETVAMMQPQANRDRVIIRSSFASRLPDVVADLRSVRQIAINLLSNAVRYTQAGGQVIVSTAYEPTGDVVMRVRDTGVGMNQGEIEQALKPFKQINALKRTRGDGTGLGLPLTKAMVEANRARFAIHSAPGEGTMVEIVFPSTRVLAG
jgi:PAS domain S-box-containing protein